MIPPIRWPHERSEGRQVPMRSLWIFTAVIVAALLLFATSLMVVLIGVGFLALD